MASPASGRTSNAANSAAPRSRPSISICSSLPPGAFAVAVTPAILFSDRQGSRYLRVPREIQLLADFQLTDAHWEGLHLPINLAFFVYSSPTQRVIALYPGPAGATESLLTLETWQDLVALNPILSEFAPDVEAPPGQPSGRGCEHFRVPIDECYKLVGLIRTNWRGLSGGTQVWAAIHGFLNGLRQRSRPRGAHANA